MNEKIEATGEKEKSYILTLLLCKFFGCYGLHRFINGKYGTGFLMLFSGGGLGIWALIDSILLMTKRFKNKDGELIGYDGKILSNPINIAVIIFYILEILLIIFCVIPLFLAFLPFFLLIFSSPF